MERIFCVYCGDLFDPSPRHKNQPACKKPECQKARKADWQKHRLRIDKVYKESQKISQQKWIQAHPGYWKTYRKRKPEQNERNRIFQGIRNRKKRAKDLSVKMDAALIAKMDRSKPERFRMVGQFYMVPVIANMDPLKVNIIEIPMGCA
jgi:hypothetical protein